MSHLLAGLQPFDSCRVAVIGDLMLDEYLWGHVERISPEAPVPVLNVVRREFMLGGAGNVVKNLRALGAQVTVLGVLGEDFSGRQVRNLLRAQEADLAELIIDAGRKTTRKVRLMSLEYGQQVFRLDDESTHTIFGEIEDRLVEAVQAHLAGTQVVICSDYMKGVLTDRVLNAIFVTAHRLGISSIVGPKDSSSQKYRVPAS